MTGGGRPDRELLSSSSGVVSVTRVWAAHDAIEVDEAEGIDVSRRRILLDEVLMVTRHRERGTAFIVVTAVVGFSFGGLAGIVALAGEADAALVVFSIFSLPFLLALAWRAVVGVDVVTVFGKRSRVALRFSPVRGRAPVVYGRLCRMARQAQHAPAPAGPEATGP